MVIHRGIFKSYQITLFPCFIFKLRVGFHCVQLDEENIKLIGVILYIKTRFQLIIKNGFNLFSEKNQICIKKINSVCRVRECEGGPSVRISPTLKPYTHVIFRSDYEVLCSFSVKREDFEVPVLCCGLTKCPGDLFLPKTNI